MQDFEKLGVFYLGKVVDPIAGKLTTELLYESKNLTTHAVCLGMTGSGKTGLGITILEEAGLDKIPSIIIDPKGDLGNLLLTFPNLSPNDFKPWIESSDAERKGMNADEYAQNMSKTWKEGLAAWGEDAERIKKFRDTVELVIYTPGSKAGIPISILNSFAAPAKEQMLDATALQERIQSISSSLLGLLNIEADPIKSREHILLSNIIQYAWNNGISLDLTKLIQQVQKPPFTKIGALDIDTFYPPKDRIALSISLNNLLASPGFQTWLEGRPLDIGEILHTNSGKPKLSIFAISHLSDSERMFFVTLLLNEVLSWMRRQPGTPSLRALLYMDEIFGYFPPIATPPSKLPMLTLLKQARAFGLGVILATQNPVDLDYKGLANCGTWFIGKLQTERDKSRVLEGLKVASSGEMDLTTLNKMLSMTGNRTFILNSIYEKRPILFQTRWSLSYLRGPMTLSQISSLTDKNNEDFEKMVTIPHESETVLKTKPNVPAGINEFFLIENSSQHPVHYEPRVVGIAKIHFIDAQNKIDVWNTISLALPPENDGKEVNWDSGTNIPDLKSHLSKKSIPESTFEELPSGLMQEKNYALFAKQLASSLYQNQTLSIYRSTNPNMISNEGESERDFKARVTLEIREKRDELIAKIKEKYSEKRKVISEKILKAQSKLTQKQQKTFLQKIQTWITFGFTLLAALLGRRITQGTITQTGTTLRRATQIGKDSQDATIAEEELKNYQQQQQDLDNQINNEILALSSKNTDDLKIETTTIKPRKSDIDVEQVALVWWPK